MSGRDVPYFDDEICDGCGAKGAYDYMGDLYCQKCVSEIIRLQKEASRE